MAPDAPPPHLEAEREGLLLEIEEAFGEVTREGGVSWSETVARDKYESPEVIAKARKRGEKRWQFLVDDPDWKVFTGIGGWAFLDAKGFRYYLPPAMVRCVRSGEDEGISWILTMDDLPVNRARQEEKWSKLDLRQRQCVKRFLRYMVAVSTNPGDEVAADDWQNYYVGWNPWQEALDSYWESVEDPPQSETSNPQ